jgi:DNA-binding MarR family transcriptional regulator
MRRRSPRDTVALRAQVQRFMRGFGLLSEAETPCGQPLHTSHAHALMILLRADGDGLHQAALARQLGIDKSNASRLVQQLARKGHIAIATAPDEDARLKRVRLTAKGARMAAAVDESSRHRFDELLGAIAPSRRRLVLDGLEHLNRALERATEGKRA